MKRLFIEPLDVLMFRSERPFVARESHVAKSGAISPLTFDGAIKSKLFLEFCKRKGYSPQDFQRRKSGSETEEEFKRSSEKLREEVKNKLSIDYELKELLEIIGYSPLGLSSKLNILGAFLSEEDKGECFLFPNDIVMADEEERTLLKLNPVIKDKLKIPEVEAYVCLSGYSKAENVSAYLSFNALKDYLQGLIPNKTLIVEKPYVIEERIGIKLEREKKKAAEAYLYKAEFLRLKDKWGFIIWYESPIEVPNGVIKLGGEGRGAICKKLNDVNLMETLEFAKLIDEVNEEKKFKLYLATPSCFNGWKPPSEKLKETLGVKNLRLIAALPGKPIYIGGYDFALNKEKPLQRWVNAGAVYYYTFEGTIDVNLVLPIRILEDNIDMRCAFIGRWGKCLKKP